MKRVLRIQKVDNMEIMINDEADGVIKIYF